MCAEDCFIVTDVEIRCEDQLLADARVSVAPTEAGVSVLTSTYLAPWLFEVQGAGGKVIDTLPHELYVPNPLVQSPEGEISVLLDTSSFEAGQYPGALLLLSEVVWIETQHDVTLEYGQSCSEQDECWCVPSIVEVVRSSLGDPNLDPPIEVLTMPIDAPLNGGVAGTTDSVSVDARAFGDRLSIALRVRDGVDSFDPARKLRVLELDTSALP